MSNVSYVRVSTIDQTTARQEFDVIIDKEFSDHVSGKTTNREGLKQCLDYLREDDHLYVFSLDRLGRNLSDLLGIVKSLVDRGVTVHFQKERMVFANGSKNPMDNLMLGILGSFAEFERELNNQRIREGVAVARRDHPERYQGKQSSLTKSQERELIELWNHPNIKKTELMVKFNLKRSGLYAAYTRITKEQQKG